MNGNITHRRAAAVFALLSLTGCASVHIAAPIGAVARAGASASPVPFPSTYHAMPSSTTVITDVMILTGDGRLIEHGSLLMDRGVIAAVGSDVHAPAGAHSIEGRGRWLTPGLIDVHSHLGNSSQPATAGNDDVNESTDPNTAQVWAEHGVWPQDPAFARALAGGVTTMQILPGSANLFGGRSVVLKNVPARTVQAMKFPDAPYGIKMACGENPKRVYGSVQKRAPGTRMGNMAGYRSAFIKAVEYRRKWEKYQRETAAGKSPDPPERDLQMETLAGVLAGEIRVQTHCYEASDMAQMIDLSKEFGYQIAAFHHATEAYKIADILAANHICAAIWADWWGFKMEAYDGIRENLPMVDAAGACAIVHSDSAIGIQHLNLAAAQAMGDGRRAGISVPPERAIQWLTLNPAIALGIERKTGSLTIGKAADVVLWSADPFSVLAHADQVYIDGALTFDRANVAMHPVSDFEVGQRAQGHQP